MVNFGGIINDSFKWTGTVLFRPFNFKKWMILTFVALLSGYLSQGGSVNINLPDRFGPEENNRTETVELIEPTAQEGASSSSCDFPAAESSKDPFDTTMVIIIVVSIVAVAISVIILLMWISSRFTFVFIEDVIKNEASIVAPFRANRQIGNSFFLFNLIFFVIYLVLLMLVGGLCIATLVKAGLFNDNVPPELDRIFEFLLVLSPYLIVGVLVIIVAALISLILKDFVSLIMFKEKIGVMRAWPKAIALFKKNIGNLTVYILIKIGFAIAASIVYFLAMLICILIFLIPVAILGFGLYLISCIIASSWALFYWIIVGILATPVLLFLWYCLVCLYLPAGVFFRTFGMKFLGSLEPQYDLFTQGAASPELNA